MSAFQWATDTLSTSDQPKTIFTRYQRSSRIKQVTLNYFVVWWPASMVGQVPAIVSGATIQQQEEAGKKPEQAGNVCNDTASVPILRLPRPPEDN